MTALLYVFWLHEPSSFSLCKYAWLAYPLLYIAGNSGRIDKIWTNSHHKLKLIPTKVIENRGDKNEKNNSKKLYRGH